MKAGTRASQDFWDISQRSPATMLIVVVASLRSTAPTTTERAPDPRRA